MKQKLFTLLTLLVLCVTGAWASTVDDLATISANHSVAFEDIMNGAGLSNGTLYDSNYLLSVGGNNYSSKKGKNSTISKLNCCRVKSTSQDRLAFKVSGACTLKVYAENRNDRLPFLSTDGTTSAVTGSFSSGTTTFTIPAAGTYYIVGNGSDYFLAGLEFTFPSGDAPTITKQPVSATYEKDDVATALSVTATASAGTLQYEWYSNTSATTEGATKVQDKSTTVTYTPSTSSAGTTYYYCKVYDTNGNTDSEFATISVVNAIAPEITYSAPTVTISCAGAGTVYYTTDGSVPSSSNGTEYTTPFNLTNSCTVRAVAKKGENYSDLVKYDCYVDQSSAEGFLISTGYHSGTQSGTVWTSTDGNFTLTSGSGNMNWSNNIFPGMHGHKMNNGTTYTLQPTEDIKITSIKIVGRTWLKGNAATVTVSGATPSSETWLAGEDGHVSYILTKEFTTSAGYGEAVTVTPANNQFGCFLEVYGVKRSGPADPVVVGGETITWDFSTSAAQSAAGTITASSSNTLKATDNTTTITYVAGSDDKYEKSNGYYLKPGGKSGTSSSKLTNRYFLLNISKSGQLSLTSNSSKPGEYLIYQGSTTNPSEATAQSSITTSEGNLTKTGNIDIANGSYLFIGFGSQIYTESLSWTPETDNIELATTDNMAGWRAFNPAGQGYTLDANTKAFIVTDTPSDNKVTLVTLAEGNQDIPGNTPVILYTTSTADSHKMTLTAKAGVDDYTGTNLLKVTTAAQDLGAGKCRLGYGANGVGFYKYAVASAPAGIVYLDAAPAQEGKGYTFVFEGETTGISNLNVNDNANIDANAPMYNLAGQRVTKSYKGVVIVNGKKMLNK